MSYQVLARKWRPHTFSEVIGQQHVLKALANALDQGRLHHAYLLSGTRGVGKTTIARILAKSLNCETGVSSKPCGQCDACRDIDQGNFVDLLEIDAASRTKVEDTREILDNVQYRPARGRFKVYLIDEVHMLSKHSFNALLKTLEEPPEHVKFLLATTDPQKLPVTVLSRCLQFHLKSLTVEQIAAQLGHVLRQENSPFQSAALDAIAKAARGSMRDALSLTEQALGFGSGELALDDVLSMLGTLDHRQIYRLLHYVASGDATELVAQLAELVSLGIDYEQVHSELASVLHRIAMAQVLPAVNQGADGEEEISLLAEQISPSDVQLFYQIAINGKRDLPYAPDGRVALEMTLLRMLAFSPAAPVSGASATLPPGTAAGRGGASANPKPQADVAEPPARQASAEAPADHGREPPSSVEPVPTIAEPVKAPVSAVEPVPAAAEPASAPSSAADERAVGSAPAPAASSCAVKDGAATAAPTKIAAEADGDAGDPLLDNVLKVRNFLRSQKLRQSEEAAGKSDGAQARVTAPSRQPERTTPAPAAAPQSVAPVLTGGGGADTRTPSAGEAVPLPEEVPPWMMEPDDGETNASPAAVVPPETPSPSVDGEREPSPACQASLPSTSSSAPDKGLPTDVDKMVELTQIEQTAVWREVINRANIGGRLRQLAMNACVRLQPDGALLLVVLPQQKHLANEKAKGLLQRAFSNVFGECGEIRFEIGDPGQETPLEMELRCRQEHWQQAKEALLADDNVRFFMQRFGAEVDEDSIKPK